MLEEYNKFLVRSKNAIAYFNGLYRKQYVFNVTTKCIYFAGNKTISKNTQIHKYNM